MVANVVVRRLFAKIAKPLRNYSQYAHYLIQQHKENEAKTKLSLSLSEIPLGKCFFSSFFFKFPSLACCLLTAKPIVCVCFPNSGVFSMRNDFEHKFTYWILIGGSDVTNHYIQIYRIEKSEYNHRHQYGYLPISIHDPF